MLTLKKVAITTAVFTSLVVRPVIASEESITIWWAQWDPAVGLEKLGQQFAEETGIGVRVHQIPWASYQDQVFLNFGNKTTDFDIVVGDSQWIGRGASRGLYLDLSEWLPQHVDLDRIHPMARRYLMEYPAGSGNYFAAPCETDALGFVYRRDWFESPVERERFQDKYGRELKPPDTWQEFLEIAEFFHRPAEKRYGCALLTGRGYDSLVMGFQPFLWSWGGSWGNRDTFEISGYIDSEESVLGLQFLINLLQYAIPGGINSDYMQVLDAFMNGSTAMVLDYFPFYPGIVDAMGTKAGFFLVPRNGDSRVISLGGQGFSISTKVSPKQQELAKQFIAWFQQTKVQEKWITFPGCFTANIDLLTSKEFASAYPFNATFAQSLNYLRDFWNVPVYNELLAAAQRSLGEALDGAKGPAEALNELAVQHDLIMRQAGLLK